MKAYFMLGQSVPMGFAVIAAPSMQAVTTGAYRAVEFIKQNIKLENVEKA